MSPDPRLTRDLNLLGMELVRATEAGALAASRWTGRGDKEGAGGAAVEAMRLLLNTVAMNGVVVIGEGEKDEAPMLYNCERLGLGTPPEVDMPPKRHCRFPVEGTTLTSLGRAKAISVIAASNRAPRVPLMPGRGQSGPEASNISCPHLSHIAR